MRDKRAGRIDVGIDVQSKELKVMDDLDLYVKVGCELADIGRKMARSAFVEGAEFQLKSDGSPVTEVDQAIERAMRDIITDRLPEHGILGEEYGNSNLDKEYIWVIDPIDGTKSFATGLPTFGSLICLCRNNVPVIGIIELPVAEQRCIGVEGQPTTFDGKPVQCRARSTLSECIMSLTGPEFYKDTAPRQGFEKIWPESQWNVYGGGCFSYASLARGYIDICVDGSNLSPYDFCAYVPVVNGAGGRITDWQGEALGLHAGPAARAKGVLACGDRGVHEQALRIISG